MLWSSISVSSSYISAQLFHQTWILDLSLHHSWSKKFMFCISLRHTKVYFLPTAEILKQLNILLSAKIIQEKYDVLRCFHLNVNLNVTWEMFNLIPVRFSVAGTTTPSWSLQKLFVHLYSDERLYLLQQLMKYALQTLSWRSFNSVNVCWPLMDIDSSISFAYTTCVQVLSMHWILILTNEPTVLLIRTVTVLIKPIFPFVKEQCW